MKYLSFLVSASISAILISAILTPALVLGQAAPTQSAKAAATSATTGTLRGQVTDPSGAVVSNATVAILVSGGPTHSATSGRNGAYEIGNLPPGKYTVTANAQGFSVFVQNDVDVAGAKLRNSTLLSTSK